MSFRYRIFPFYIYFNQMIRIKPTFFCLRLSIKTALFLFFESNHLDGHHHWSHRYWDAIATNSEFRNKSIKLSMIDGFWKEPKKQRRRRRRRRRRFVKLFVQREKRRADKRFKNKLKRCLLCMQCVCLCWHVCKCAYVLHCCNIVVAVVVDAYFVISYDVFFFIVCANTKRNKFKAERVKRAGEKKN